MKKLTLEFCLMVGLGLAAGTHAQAQVYEYDFVPAVGETMDNVGNPTGDWSAQLYLDQPSFTGGGVSDIVALVMQTPYGTIESANDQGPIRFATSHSGSNPVLFAPDSGAQSFDWTTTTITSMAFYAVVGNPSNDTIEPDYPGTIEWAITQSSIQLQAPDPLNTYLLGSWVAVPDSGSTAMMAGLAAIGVLGLDRFRRNRRLA